MSWVRLLFFCALCGCASLKPGGQVILVKSDPPGAEIRHEGKVIGFTPDYVSVPRSYRPEILVTGPRGDAHKVQLETRYRWGTAFWSNLIFLTLAPIGWGLDLLTGKAWDVQDPDPIEIKPGFDTKPAKQRRIAVAPPAANYLALSDESGEIWEKELQRRLPKADVLPYRQTLSTFLKYHYDFDSRPEERDRLYPLLRDLEVSHVFQSEVREKDRRVEMNGSLMEVISRESSQPQSLEIATETREFKDHLRWYQRASEFFYIIPNTISVESTSHMTTVKADDIRYESSLVEQDDPARQALVYLSAIGVSRLNLPRLDRGAFWRFHVVPAVRLSVQNIEFTTLPVIQEYRFRSEQVFAGLGPEVGWQNGAHYLYANFVPMLGWQRVSWSESEQTRAISHGTLAGRFEFGYLYFFGRQFSLRLFTKATNMSRDAWEAAIGQISRSTLHARGVSEASTGIALNYTFEPDPKIRRWLRAEPKRSKRK